MTYLDKLSTEDRLAIIQKSVDIRRKRLEIKYKLKGNQLTLSNVLKQRSDKIIGGITLYHFLMSLPAIGIKKTEEILISLGYDLSSGKKKYIRLLEEHECIYLIRLMQSR